MKPTGYSGTPLAKKLGIKAGSSVRLIHQPANYLELFESFPDVNLASDSNLATNLIHFFTVSRAELSSLLPRLKNEIARDGCIWVSWPKKSSRVDTDITEDVIREVALPLGLVDVKVCAVDETWSGLKLVIRVENRK